MREKLPEREISVVGGTSYVCCLGAPNWGRWLGECPWSLGAAPATDSSGDGVGVGFSVGTAVVGLVSFLVTCMNHAGAENVTGLMLG